jgi:cyclopropane fatty-acyl-phospholipid synthase-like methyltransferase
VKARSEWETFFDGHAPIYMQNPFTRDTENEVAFLVKELALPPASRILDIGCGTGRHAIALARRGHRVTGLDLSSGMLAQAVKAANEAGAEVRWIHADATRFTTRTRFDAAICLCEGAFGLLGMKEDAEEHDRSIVRNAWRALKPGAPFLLTALNGLRKIRQFTQADVDNGAFDPLTLVETISVDCETPRGRRTLKLRERGYLPQDLARLLQQVGFEVRHIWGGTAGNWGRRSLELDEMEVMVVSRKRPRGRGVHGP